MIAIQTKYLGPTNTKGARIKAFTGKLSVTIPSNYKKDGALLHFEAVKALKEKYSLDWDLSEMTYGGLKEGYAFTFPHSTVGIITINQ